ncbi:MAG: T9SS type A sorting domain-containing protein [Bacteroidetes bacterium]|nr:T9SS type A sorting domain-containing protein [Bacteroidota bacterium]MCL1969571.1 T9SS type A sorting domain-containing protein [Bacteroidota bacterium]
MEKMISKKLRKFGTRFITAVLAMLLFAPFAIQAKVNVESHFNNNEVEMLIIPDIPGSPYKNAKKPSYTTSVGLNSGKVDGVNVVPFNVPAVGSHIEDTQHFNLPSRNYPRSGVYVGDPASTTYSANIPAAFYNQHSLNQTIYQQSMINHYGKIKEIIYPLVNAIRYSPHTVQIWMAQTDKTSFEGTDDWIPFSNFTLVYTNENGYDFNGYLGDVYVTLDTPFDYSEGNLVIMTNKVGSNWDPSPYVRWLFTPSSIPMNTIHALRQPPSGGFNPTEGYPSTSTGEYVINNSTAPNLILQFDQNVDYDIALRGFKGSNFSEFNEPLNYSVVIRNLGKKATNEYTLRLMHNTDELTSVSGVLIQPNQTVMVQIPYAFHSAGTYDVHVVVDFQENVPLEDLVSPLITTKVYPKGYSLFYVGENPGNSFANSPIHDAMNKSSVSQMIYREELLGDLKGKITEMIFFYLRSSGENPENCRGMFYMSPTEREEFDLGLNWADRDKFFEPLSQYELIFDDIIPWNVPFGAFIPITYTLTEPYLYTGGNISLMDYVPWFDATPVTGTDVASIWDHTAVDYWAWGFTANSESQLPLDDYVALFDQTGIVFWGQSVANVIFVSQTEESGIDSQEIPKIASLKGNYPNPFNQSTMISFEIAKPGNVKIEIFNFRGQLVNTILNEYHLQGQYSVEWNGKANSGIQVSSGLYFYRMTTENGSETKKMLLMK